ncbi:MAG: malate dehydrogenase [Candidatus Cloacimonetes bacterium]|nr:malate dehydrogenase [Candidatus Cloacimonadota bacterium]
MKKILLSLDNLDDCFPDDFTDFQIAAAKTMFYKALASEMHKYYGGKMQTLPKAGIYGQNWFNVWYTPGVSAVSTAIRDDIQNSITLSNRGNLVAVVSDSTRVLGDGDCGVFGGLGVMEGKAFLMKYLADVDAVALCIDNRDKKGKPNAQKVIDFVNMVSPSFGAVNLEDISQPNCYKILDELRDNCSIPVWHDDAQGTACVILAGVINALRLVEKDIADSKIVLLGSGAANSCVAEYLLLLGADLEKMILLDSKGGLHNKRYDIQKHLGFYRQWELCQKTNPKCIDDTSAALQKADILIALSAPGPDVVRPEWIAAMNQKPIVFACANPVPEIYPYAAKEAGAFIVATGRGDFPNQVNNSLGFPGILKGTLLTSSTKITDNMALSAARALADFTSQRDLHPEHILPLMNEAEAFAEVAEAVGQQAIRDKVARVIYPEGEIRKTTLTAIQKTRATINKMTTEGFIKQPSIDTIQQIFCNVIKDIQQGEI